MSRMMTWCSLVQHCAGISGVAEPQAYFNFKLESTTVLLDIENISRGVFRFGVITYDDRTLMQS